MQKLVTRLYHPAAAIFPWPTVAAAVPVFWDFVVALSEGQTISPSSTAKRSDPGIVVQFPICCS